MISQISINETSNYTLLIIELYNKILSCDAEDFQLLKLNLTDLIQIAHKLVEYFFELTTKINGKFISFKLYVKFSFLINKIFNRRKCNCAN
jgi:hypothetical protein